MRRYHKKLVLDMMDSLKQANIEVEKYLENGNMDGFTNLLADSQDIIENIHIFFNSYKDVPSEIMEEINLYYQFIFQLHQTPNFEILKKMQNKLVILTDLIKNKVEAKKIEVAFFPYSAAMFDSLESVWMSAKEDPDCDAYLVPIPYYSKDSNGNLAEMHYDGEFYKDKYDIINWTDYDVKARHPDIIYIHNPYDNANHVTSVHPNFYSTKLKPYTELLAYIPYFITRNNLDVNFSLPPATVVADKVFVQSEQDRDIYIENHFKYYNIDKNISKNRFIAIGSPKIDKVLGSKKEDFSLPENWDLLIKNADGTDKKIILYITSLSALLNGGVEYIKKLQSVFEYFSKRDDVTLWWRPHPLTDSTFKSMRPELQKAYNMIVNLYKGMGFGIYDDTYDLHRAIAYSDAYYGDISSVAGLYGFTDKILIYQSLEIQDYTEETEDTFEKTLKRCVSLYNNRKEDVNLYLIWEALTYRVPILIKYLINDVSSSYFDEFISGRKKLHRKLLISNAGKTGERIYKYCKIEVLK